MNSELLGGGKPIRTRLSRERIREVARFLKRTKGWFHKWRHDFAKHRYSAQTNVFIRPEIVWGDRAQKQVIFTFDGGGRGQSSAQAILDTLERHSVRATFFLTGKSAARNPLVTKQIAEAGHEIFNHTYTHSRLPQLSDASIAKELKRTEDVIQQLTALSTQPYFRAPYGERDQRVLEVAGKEGYQSVYWTIDALDWKESSGANVGQVKARILTNLRPGTIYLMHIDNNITGQVLDEAFTEIEARGYAIMSLSDGIAWAGPKLGMK